MRLRDRLLNRRETGDAGSATAGSATEGELSIPDYGRLDDKEVGARLHELSQEELTALDGYERSHRARPTVLNKLRYMRTSEPLPGYDTLGPEQIVEALAGADTETVKSVRDYERKFGGRREVLDEAARVLPTSTPSARERRAREESAARVSEGVAGRAKTSDQLASRGSTPPVNAAESTG
jgi:hypothetical protein